MTRINRRAANRGMSLTEVIVGLAVLTILAGVGVPVLLRTLEISEEAVTVRKVQAMRDGLRAFYRDHGRFPTQGEGLASLVNDPGTGSWLGPYIPLASTPTETMSDGRGGTIGYSLSGADALISPPNFPELALTVNAAPVIQGWIERTRQELGVLNDAAETYRANQGSYPSSVDDLVPAYLGADFGTDPWGRDYRVDGGQQTLYSAGPDGTAGNSDDIYSSGLGQAGSRGGVKGQGTRQGKGQAFVTHGSGMAETA